MNNWDYPVGADNSRAPWNEIEQPEREIEVTCSNTLSKDLTISVTDYKIDGYDEDNCPCFDYSDCNLVKAFTEQQFTAKQALDLAAEFAKRIYTTLNGHEYPTILADLAKRAAVVFNACEGWNEDELEVVVD